MWAGLSYMRDTIKKKLRSFIKSITLFKIRYACVTESFIYICHLCTEAEETSFSLH